MSLARCPAARHLRAWRENTSLIRFLPTPSRLPKNVPVRQGSRMDHPSPDPGENIPTSAPSSWHQAPAENRIQTVAHMSAPFNIPDPPPIAHHERLRHRLRRQLHAERKAGCRATTEYSVIMAMLTRRKACRSSARWRANLRSAIIGLRRPEPTFTNRSFFTPRARAALVDQRARSAHWATAQ